MKSKEFDDLVRGSFESARLPYNPENWQKLAAILPDGKKKTGIRYLLVPLASVAASVAMAIGITTWVDNTGFNSAVVAKSATTSRHIVRTPAQHLDAPTFDEITPFESIEPATLPVAQHIPAPRKQETIPITQKEEQQKPVQEILIAANDPLPSSSENTVGSVFYQNLTPAKKEKRTYMSMNAGYNYGTLKSGYVMGVTIGRKLNETFFVESDVSVVGNMASSNTKLSFTTGSTAAAEGKYTDGPGIITKTKEIQKYYNIFYLQVAPSVGMKLSPKVSIGMGADVQRLLQDKKLIVNASDGKDQKTLPMYDMGATVKAEYNLTKEIKASLNYRKGLNKALGGDEQLLDRDYLQLQLKFNILNK